MEHAESEKRGGNGENLAWVFNSAIDFKTDWDTTAPQRWYDEIWDYNFLSGTSVNGKATGHFTQIVWKDSTKLGCGHATDGT